MSGRILIVDDEQTLLDLLGIAFDGTCETETALTAEAGLAIFERGGIDLLLSDKNLPGMSGVDLIRKVRALDEKVGIVMMTAYATAESVRETLNLGIDAYIEKPFADIVAVTELIVGIVKQRKSGAAPLPPPGSGGGLRVLVAAADEETRRKIIAPIDLSMAQVEFAGSRGEVLASIENRRPHLVIIDGSCYPVTDIAERVLVLAPEATSVVMSAEVLAVPVLRRLVDLRVCGVFDKTFDDTYTKGINALLQRIKNQPARLK